MKYFECCPRAKVDQFTRTALGRSRVKTFGGDSARGTRILLLDCRDNDFSLRAQPHLSKQSLNDTLFSPNSLSNCQSSTSLLASSTVAPLRSTVPYACLLPFIVKQGIHPLHALLWDANFSPPSIPSIARAWRSAPTLPITVEPHHKLRFLSLAMSYWKICHPILKEAFKKKTKTIYSKKYALEYTAWHFCFRGSEWDRHCWKSNENDFKSRMLNAEYSRILMLLLLHRKQCSVVSSHPCRSNSRHKRRSGNCNNHNLGLMAVDVKTRQPTYRYTSSYM